MRQLLAIVALAFFSGYAASTSYAQPQRASKENSDAGSDRNPRQFQNRNAGPEHRQSGKAHDRDEDDVRKRDGHRRGTEEKGASERKSHKARGSRRGPSPQARTQRGEAQRGNTRRGKAQRGKTQRGKTQRGKTQRGNSQRARGQFHHGEHGPDRRGGRSHGEMNRGHRFGTASRSGLKYRPQFWGRTGPPTWGGAPRGGGPRGVQQHKAGSQTGSFRGRSYGGPWHNGRGSYGTRARHYGRPSNMHSRGPGNHRPTMHGPRDERSRSGEHDAGRGPHRTGTRSGRQGGRASQQFDRRPGPPTARAK